MHKLTGKATWETHTVLYTYYTTKNKLNKKKNYSHLHWDFLLILTKLIQVEDTQREAKRSSDGPFAFKEADLFHCLLQECQ